MEKKLKITLNSALVMEESTCSKAVKVEENLTIQLLSAALVPNWGGGGGEGRTT